MRGSSPCRLALRIPVLPLQSPRPIRTGACTRLAGWLPRLLSVALVLLLQTAGLAGALLGSPASAWAGLNDDRYDGNIFALYAGNGSLVPPRSTLAEARAEGRVAVVVYYLDDSSVSKRFAPVVSELQRQWGNSIELGPIRRGRAKILKVEISVGHNFAGGCAHRSRHRRPPCR